MMEDRQHDRNRNLFSTLLVLLHSPLAAMTFLNVYVLYELYEEKKPSISTQIYVHDV